MGLIYTLAIVNFQDLGELQEETKLENLKAYLQNIEHDNSVELLCLDNCLTCNILVDNEVYSSTSAFDNLIDSSITTYKYDFNLGVQEQEKKVFFNNEGVEERVCFSYKIDKNRVGDQVIIKLKNKIYDFSTFTKYPAVYNSFDDLEKDKEKLRQEVLQ